MNLSSSLASAYTEASTPIRARRAPSLFAKALSSFPCASQLFPGTPHSSAVTSCTCKITCLPLCLSFSIPLLHSTVI
uniref:ORF76B n=1 Tax=Oryza sativa subsp. japonica TaxID=39947 RepID=Q35312_ORYSJ|nr:ORF76B [Oryza sativa Japonica Group]